MLDEKTFYDLSMISYFDAYQPGVSVDTLIQQILEDTVMDEEYPNDVTLPYHKEALAKIPKGRYSDIYSK